MILHFLTSHVLLVIMVHSVMQSEGSAALKAFVETHMRLYGPDCDNSVCADGSGSCQEHPILFPAARLNVTITTFSHFPPGQDTFLIREARTSFKQYADLTDNLVVHTHMPVRKRAELVLEIMFFVIYFCHSQGPQENLH